MYRLHAAAAVKLGGLPSVPNSASYCLGLSPFGAADRRLLALRSRSLPLLLRRVVLAVYMRLAPLKLPVLLSALVLGSGRSQEVAVSTYCRYKQNR